MYIDKERWDMWASLWFRDISIGVQLYINKEYIDLNINLLFLDIGVTIWFFGE